MPAESQEALHRLVGDALDELGLCGCGTPGPTLLRLLVLLDELSRPAEERLLWRSQAGEVLWQFPLYVLDKERFIEHGGVVDFGWLTKAGEDFLANYRQLGPYCASFIDPGQICPGCLERWGIRHRSDCPLPRLGVLLHTSVFSEVRSFEAAWEDKQREGYQYGRDALEQVRFGWELRDVEERRKKRGECP